MAKNNLITRAVSLFFTLLCIGGLLWQLITIFNLYFQYRVSTAINVFTPEVLDPLAMTFCVKMLEITDIKKANQDLKTNYLLKDVLDELSIQNLFDYTPSKESVLLNVEYKTMKFFKLRNVTENVNNHVTIQKFMQRGYVCYKISLKEEERLMYREIAVTSYSQFLVKRLTFSDIFNKVKRFKGLLGRANQLPYKEMISTVYTWGMLLSCLSYQRDLLFLTFFLKHCTVQSEKRFTSNHMTINKILLPSPYQTDCFDYSTLGFQNKHHCIEECVGEESLRSFGKVNIFSPVTKTSNLKFISYKNLLDDDTSYKFWKIEKQCENQCSRSECRDEEVITLTDSTKNTTDLIVWDHMVISQISFKITSTPTLSLVEFVVYILGSISTWTGVSVIACNPVAMLKSSLLKPRLKSPGSNDRVHETKEKRQQLLDLHKNSPHLTQFSSRFHVQFNR